MPIHLRQVKFGHLTLGPHVVALDASQRGYVLVIDDRRFVMGDRARWTVATTVVVVTHLLIIWGLIVYLPRDMQLPDHDQDVIQADQASLCRLLCLRCSRSCACNCCRVPCPSLNPNLSRNPSRRNRPRRRLPWHWFPRRLRRQPTTVAAPFELAMPMPQVVNRPQETFDTPRTPTLQARADVKLQSTQAPDQTLDPESKTANVKLKKKQEEELEAHQTLTATAASDSDIKLHETTASPCRPW